MSGCRTDEIHIPVMLRECLRYLAPRSGGLYVDGTLGPGGHSEAILEQSSPDGRLIAFDWDESALVRARQRLARFGKRVEIIRGNFAEMRAVLTNMEAGAVDGLLLDVGLSSLQLDFREGRGFSFRYDEPLDMRMDNRREITAALIVNGATEEELADILYCYGEEKQARRIAKAIVRARTGTGNGVETTTELATIVSNAVPKRFHPKRIHVATKTFQALRICVNNEAENLAAALENGAELLAPGASFCVISFHSLEDRIVKRKFRENSELEIITAKPVRASEREIARNPRARSARLRVARRK